jgi:hypothetical protein
MTRHAAPLGFDHGERLWIALKSPPETKQPLPLLRIPFTPVDGARCAGSNESQLNVSIVQPSLHRPRKRLQGSKNKCEKPGEEASPGGFRTRRTARSPRERVHVQSRIRARVLL